MKKTLMGIALVLGSSAASACFLSGEETDGMNKICYYQCASGRKAITVRAMKMCPMSISQAPGAAILATRLPEAPPILLAHSGGTDSKGCHRDHKTGDYHCH